MKDFNDNSLKPEQSWLEAEKMLDKHFYRKRMITWLLTFFISALVITGSILVLHNSKDDAAQQKINVEKQPADFSSAEKNNSTAQNQEPVVSNNQTIKKNEIKSTFSSTNVSPSKEKSNHAIAGHDKTENGMKSMKNENGSVALVSHESGRKPDLVKSPGVNQKETMNAGSTSVAAGLSNSTTDEMQSGNHNASEQITNTESITSIHPLLVPVELADNSIREKRNPDEITLPPNKFNLQLSVYGSAQYVFKNVTSEMYPQYADRRTNEEDGTITMSFGASLSHAMKNMSASIGIEYSSWGEENRYVPYLNKKNTVENGNYESYMRSDSNTIYNTGIVFYQHYQVLDSSFISHQDTVVQPSYDPSVNTANSENRLHYIEIPVELSYRLTHSRVGVGITAGISPAWLTCKKGYYLTRDMSGVEQISEMESFNSFIINGRFSVDLYCRMNDRMSVVLRPQVKANLNSVFKDDYQVDQKYYSTGLVFGLQYFIR